MEALKESLEKYITEFQKESWQKFLRERQEFVKRSLNEFLRGITKESLGKINGQIL